MRTYGRQVWRVLAVAAVTGSLVVASGCSKLKTSLEKQDTVTVADLQAKVQTLEQQVADLHTSMAQLTEAQPVDSGAAGTGLSAGTNPGFQAARAVVTASYLNVRNEPNAESQKVAVLREGSVVQVMAEEGNWAKVSVTHEGNKIKGWVSKEFIRKQD